MQYFFSFKNCLEINCNNDKKDPTDEKILSIIQKLEGEVIIKKLKK